MIINISFIIMIFIVILISITYACFYKTKDKDVCLTVEKQSTSDCDIAKAIIDFKLSSNDLFQ